MHLIQFPGRPVLLKSWISYLHRWLVSNRSTWREEALSVWLNTFSIWEERCKLTLYNTIVLHHKSPYVCCVWDGRKYLRNCWNTQHCLTRSTRIHFSKIWKLVAFTSKICWLSQVPLGQVTCIPTHLFSKLRSSSGWGDSSYNPISSHIYQDCLY